MIFHQSAAIEKGGYHGRDNKGKAEWVEIDKSIIPGYKELKYRVRLKGNGTPEQYEEVHKTVVATSPDYYNISRAIELNAELVFE